MKIAYNLTSKNDDKSCLVLLPTISDANYMNAHKPNADRLALSVENGSIYCYATSTGGHPFRPYITSPKHAHKAFYCSGFSSMRAQLQLWGHVFVHDPGWKRGTHPQHGNCLHMPFADYLASVRKHLVPGYRPKPRNRNKEPLYNPKNNPSSEVRYVTVKQESKMQNGSGALPVATVARIATAIEGNYDEAGKRYLNGLSDAKIAKETGFACGVVSQVREEAFGPLVATVDPSVIKEVAKLSADLSAAEDLIRALQEQAEDLRKRVGVFTDS